MPALDVPAPVRMHRVAVAAMTDTLRSVLVGLAGLGILELAGELPPAAGPASDALHRMEAGTPGRRATATIAAAEPDLSRLEQQGARDLVAGEVELDRRKRMAITEGDVSVLVGWTPDQHLDALRSHLRAAGAAVVELPSPRTEVPPTLLRSARLAAPFRVLVDTYGILPYSDVDPTAFAAIAFIVMFGMMFGDVGHGVLLMLLGLFLARQRTGRLARLRPSWPLLVAAGASGAFFGLLYGECFGPTGIVPTLWLAPLGQPLRLLEAGIVVGSGLLAISYVLGSANRWREHGPAAALYAEGGLAGALVFAGAAVAFLGAIDDSSPARATGVGIALVGVGLLFVGALAQAGWSLGGITRGLVEVMDNIVRIGSNVISFARLAAFGMTHAALSLVTLEGVRQVAGGPVGWVLAVVLFVIGTAVALALEGMVATIQALRLEYYELFSRIFEEEGRPFVPFALPVRSSGEITEEIA
jgi:V/A-type H+-transporting ATPase subunit I